MLWPAIATYAVSKNFVGILQIYMVPDLMLFIIFINVIALIFWAIVIFAKCYD